MKTLQQPVDLNGEVPCANCGSLWTAREFNDDPAFSEDRVLFECESCGEGFLAFIKTTVEAVDRLPTEQPQALIGGDAK